jgi:hypothetical protein
MRAFYRVTLVVKVGVGPWSPLCIVENGRTSGDGARRTSGGLVGGLRRRAHACGWSTVGLRENALGMRLG